VRRRRGARRKLVVGVIAVPILADLNESQIHDDEREGV
jgi:hypothetical protein